MLIRAKNRYCKLYRLFNWVVPPYMSYCKRLCVRFVYMVSTPQWLCKYKISILYFYIIFIFSFFHISINVYYNYEMVLSMKTSHNHNKSIEKLVWKENLISHFDIRGRYLSSFKFCISLYQFKVKAIFSILYYTTTKYVWHHHWLNPW